MGALFSVAYGVGCYVLFLGTFLYAVGFVGDLSVPKSVDRGIAVPLADALIVNTLLLRVFAAQHSVMARHSFKRRWTRFVSPAIPGQAQTIAGRQVSNVLTEVSGFRHLAPERGDSCSGTFDTLAEANSRLTGTKRRWRRRPIVGIVAASREDTP